MGAKLRSERQTEGRHHTDGTALLPVERHGKKDTVDIMLRIIIQHGTVYGQALQ